MTFGKWLVVGVEAGFFLFGLVGFFGTGKLDSLALAAFGMFIVLVGYGISES